MNEKTGSLEAAAAQMKVGLPTAYRVLSGIGSTASTLILAALGFVYSEARDEWHVLKADVEAWRSTRDEALISTTLAELRRVAESSDPADNIMIPTLAFAKAGGTTGEWAATLRDVFGEYRAPTGVSGGTGHRGQELAPVVARSKAITERTGQPPRLLVAKPGLDGHSNGAEQIAVAARDGGFEVIYQGIRLTPAEIVAAAVDEDVDVVGISILSGSHLQLIPEILVGLKNEGSGAAVVVGGIIPDDDAASLRAQGIDAVFTPKDFRFEVILETLLDLVEARRN
jgi:(2R)-ethylmalonyl-CoA mutase